MKSLHILNILRHSVTGSKITASLLLASVFALAMLGFYQPATASQSAPSAPETTCPAGGRCFADVPPGSPFYEFANSLYMHDIVSGYACGGPGEPCDDQNRPYFRPGNNATRGQISKIVAIAAGFEEEVPEDQQTFTDVPEDSPFWVYIERLAARRIISGYGDASRCPETGAPCFRYNDNTTRGQMAKIAANTFFPNCETPARR